MEVIQARRSTRLAQRVNSLHLEQTTNLPRHDSSCTQQIAHCQWPPKKKVATSSSKPKRVKLLGRLSSLLFLPLDIFFEICAHLHPLDLLHLSRASRHFARMFLGRQNQHAWVAARRTVEGLPDCPTDLTEARYAHLLFESICSGCGKIGRRLLFNLRVRFCASCYKAKVETHTTVDGVHHPLDTLLQIVPHNYSGSDSSVVEYLENQYNTVIDEFMRVRGGPSGDVFLKERRDAVLALVKHGLLVSDFLDALQERKELEKLRLRVTRKLQIDARIMAMGYARHEIPVASTEYQDEITKPKALTERAWQGMAYNMRELAASRRAQIIKQRIRARLGEWLRVYASVYPTRADWPTALNAAQTDVVTDLLSEADAGIPFTLARFTAHAARIVAEVGAWRDEATGAVERGLAAAYGMPAGAGAAARDGAAAVIRCGECAQVLFAAAVMHHLHVCASQRVLCLRRDWGYDVALHRMARALLYHAGLALEVTSKQVGELKGRLVCGYGAPTTGAPMGFLELVTYLLDENWECDETFKLRKLGGRRPHCNNGPHAELNEDEDDPPETGALVVLLEMALPSTAASPHPPTAEGPLGDDAPCCRACGEACYMQVDMRGAVGAGRHMQVAHGKAEVLEEDLCAAKDILRAARDFVDAHGGQLIVTKRTRCGDSCTV